MKVPSCIILFLICLSGCFPRALNVYSPKQIDKHCNQEIDFKKAFFVFSESANTDKYYHNIREQLISELGYLHTNILDSAFYILTIDKDTRVRNDGYFRVRFQSEIWQKDNKKFVARTTMSSVMYRQDLDKLGSAILNAYRNCRPNGSTP